MISSLILFTYTSYQGHTDIIVLQYPMVQISYNGQYLKFSLSSFNESRFAVAL